MITEQLASLSGVPSAEIDPSRPVQEYGLSSRDALVLAGYLEIMLGRSLPPTLVWDHPTINGLARALSRPPRRPTPGGSAPAGPAAAGQGPGGGGSGGAGPAQPGQAGGRGGPGRSRPRGESARAEAARGAPGGPGAEPCAELGAELDSGLAGEGIAVVGLGCRLPGGPSGTVGDPERLWEFLAGGGHAVTDMPRQRWAAFDDGSAAAGEALSAVTPWAAVLGDVAGFDAAFFGISPGEAAAMDPQQRMLLEVSWEALEHAGIPPRSLRGSRTGVFTGLSATEYAFLTTSDLSRVHGWTVTGAAGSIAAGRVSYLLDLRGPSLVVDTACSSSLLAVHLAAASLRGGETDLALAGGASLLLSPVITMTFDAGGGTSPDGRCRPFDARANGMVRGEGCGVVVLKRLADARRDGDRVLAVIAGSAANSDGRSNGLVAPSPSAQRDVLRAAYAAAGISPDRADYVEAHGTGTPLGDPIEAGALGEVLGAGRPPGRPLLIGSVKSNIGHLEAAAGVAGLIKAVLAVHRKEIPPTLHFEEPSPHIPMTDLGLRVVAEPSAWPANPWLATAGVSAFGFSGTNVHVVLTGAPDAVRTAGQPDAVRHEPAASAGAPVRLVLSDASPERIREQAARLAAWLGSRPDSRAPADAAARTLERRRGRGPHQAAILGRDRAELLAGLRALGSGEPSPGVVSGRDGQGGPGIAFVFSGYGSQWAGMTSALAAAEPAFAAALAELEPLVQETAGISLTETATDPDALRQVRGAQPVLFAVQVALARLWAAYGVRPAAVIGHSMGEVAAAVVSGALTAAQGAEVIATRSRLLSRLAGAGAMALVGLPAADVTALYADLPGVHLAGISSPMQTVLAGAADQVQELARRVGARGADARVLAAEGAGHSPQVDPLLGELTAGLAAISPGPALVRFYSSAYDDPRATPECDAAYWAANLRQPAKVGPAVTAAVQDGLRTFVEISPHPLLGRALGQALEHEDAGPGLVTGSLRRGGDAVLTFHAQLARLAAGGHAVRGEAPGPLLDLPPAPWLHERHWTDSSPRPAAHGHPLLGAHVELPGGRHAWQLTAPLRLRDLVGSGQPGDLFGLGAAAEMAAAAACEAWQAATPDLTITGLRLERLLPLLPGITVLTTTLDPSPAGQGAAIQIQSRTAAGAWVLVATATAVPGAVAGPGPDAAGLGVTGPAPNGAAGRLPERRRVPIPAARLARGQRVPAPILDRCLAAAASAAAASAGTVPGQSAGLVPVAAGRLRVRGSCARGGDCEVTVSGTAADGAALAAVRLSSAGGALELDDIRLRPVCRSEIAVPYRDKLLARTWHSHDTPPVPQPGARRWVIAGPPPVPEAVTPDSIPAPPPASPAPASPAPASPAPASPPPASPPPASPAPASPAPASQGPVSSGQPGPASSAGTGGAGGHGLAEAIADALRAAGHEADLAGEDWGGGAGSQPPTGGDPMPGGLVLVAPPAPLPPDAAQRFVLMAARAAASLGAWPGPPPRLWVVTAGALAVRPGEAGDPGLAAVQGLIRVLALEQPALRATLIDLGPGTDPAAVAAELAADAGDDEIALRGGARLTARLVAAPGQPAPGHSTSGDAATSGGTTNGTTNVTTGGTTGGAGPQAARPVVRPGGGYLITGGYGGLGLLVARWLAERGAGRIVLSGRGGPPDSAREQLSELAKAGADVLVVRGDVAEPGVAERLVGAVTHGGTELRGVVHAAGVFIDALAADLTAADLARVWAPKARGAWRLHEATADADLDWMVLFSSAAALLGSPGQAGYATANAWLDAFAAWRRARGLPATAIGWGTWSGAGAAGGVAIRGISPVTPDEGIEALEALLAEDRAVAGVVRIDPAAAAAAYPEIAALPYFGPLLGAAAAPAGEDGWPGPDAIRAAAPERRVELAGQQVRRRVADVLGVAPDRLPADLPLTDAGMDSLAAVRIGNLIGHDLAVTVDPGALLAGTTLAALQATVAKALPVNGSGPGHDERPAPPGAGQHGNGAASPGHRYSSSEGERRVVEPRDAAERQVARVTAEVLGTSLDSVTRSLPALGLTEAAQAQVAARLAAENGRRVDAAALWAGGLTVEAAAGAIRQADEDEAGALVRTLQPGGPGAVPLLLGHPAGGTTGVYKMLAGLLGPQLPVLGLERTEGEVISRAAEYADVITRRWPATPVLGGWSFGGVLAYEIARQLAAAGQAPPLVVLLDAALPLPIPPGSEEAALARRFAAFARYLSVTYGRPVRLDESELAGLTESGQHALLGQRMAEAELDTRLSPAILAHQESSHRDTRALERYPAGPYDGPVVLYRADQETPWAVRDPRYEIGGEARGWHRLCRDLTIEHVAAHHLNVLDPPAVHAIAAHLRTLLCRPEEGDPACPS